MNVDKQTIIRCHKRDAEHPYVVTSRALIRNNNLTIKDRFLLIFILSNRDDWKIYPRQLAKELGIGKNAVYASIKNLIANGYCRYTQEKDKDNQFFIGCYEFAEDPIYSNNSSPELKKSFPNPRFGDPENRDPENGTLISNIASKKEQQKEVFLSADADDILSFFIETLKKIKPDIKLPENKKKWLQEVDRMIRLDKRSIQIAKEIIKWLPSDMFWSNIIRSTTALRKHFDTLESLKNSNRNGSNANIELANKLKNETYSSECEITVKEAAIHFIPQKGADTNPVSILFSNPRFKDEVNENVIRFKCKWKAKNG